MRFTVVTTGRFRLSRAFGFGLAASSQTQLSVVNSLTRPAGLAPAWLPASPAHAVTMQEGSGFRDKKPSGRVAAALADGHTLARRGRGGCAPAV